MKHSPEMDDLPWERSSTLSKAGIGALRLALLFGSAAIALTLIAVPVAERSLGTARLVPSAGLDFMSTGSVASAGSSYTIRRSVLQNSPGAVCIIGSNGQRRGDC